MVERFSGDAVSYMLSASCELCVESMVWSMKIANFNAAIGAGIKCGTMINQNMNNLFGILVIQAVLLVFDTCTGRIKSMSSTKLKNAHWFTGSRYDVCQPQIPSWRSVTYAPITFSSDWSYRDRCRMSVIWLFICAIKAKRIKPCHISQWHSSIIQDATII